jgi:hypothetical protein
MYLTREELTNRLRKEINRSLYVNFVKRRKLRINRLLYLNRSLYGRLRNIIRLNRKYNRYKRY